MGPRSLARQKRLYAISAAVLALGLAAAALVWFTATVALPEGVAYVVVDGVIQPISPGESKAYMREIERFGGKGGVLLDEIDRWFAGLWQRRSLGVTLGWISVLAALALALFAHDMPHHPGSED